MKHSRFSTRGMVGTKGFRSPSTDEKKAMMKKLSEDFKKAYVDIHNKDYDGVKLNQDGTINLEETSNADMSAINEALKIRNKMIFDLFKDKFKVMIPLAEDGKEVNEAMSA